MNIHEQRMCEMQEELFSLSVDRYNCGSPFFIFKFMMSELAKELDDIDDPFNYISPNNAITILEKLYPSLLNTTAKKYPKKVIGWMGYIYRAWCIIKNKKSSDIYRVMKADRMLSLYDVYHTFSPEYCVDTLEELIKEDEEPIDSYELFKTFREPAD